MWFTPDDIINKQRLFNLLLGARGCGKTYGCQSYGVRRKQKDKTFEMIWLRRYDEDRKEAKKDFFNDLNRHNHFPNTEFNIQGNVGYMNDEPFIRFSALSIDSRRRGLNTANVQLIVFDEFLLQANQRYLPNEFETFLSYYDSVARPNDPSRKRVPVLFLGNAMTMINPYFIGFNVRFNEKGRFSTKHIYAELLKDKEFEQHSNSTAWAEIIRDTSYYEHAINNDFLYDNSNFVEKRSTNARHTCALYYKGRKIGVWIDWSVGKIWLSNKTDPSCKFEYTLSADDATPNVLSAKYFKGTSFYTYLSTAYNSGNLFYEDLELKNDWHSIVRIINM